MRTPLYPAGTARAMSRSLRVYHGDKSRQPAMDALYGRFLKTGDLAFDIGSHVGDRISSFRRLGARVVALEPQPGPSRVLRLIHGRDPDVTLWQTACGAETGELSFRINSANPTVSTASTEFIGAAAGAVGWEGQTWDHEVTVPVTTLDALVARFGVPALVKIDVEGFEAEVLRGLSTRLPAISFEFTTIQRAVAFDCLAILSRLGPYRFDLALGETQEFVFGEPRDGEAMAKHVAGLPHEANSGDIYAILETSDR